MTDFSSVSLKVSQGSCVDREIELFIRNGEISHAGDRSFFTAEGRVGERGRPMRRRAVNARLCPLIVKTNLATTIAVARFGPPPATAAQAPRH